MSRLRSGSVAVLCLSAVLFGVGQLLAGPPAPTVQIPPGAHGHEVTMILMENQQRLARGIKPAPPPRRNDDSRDTDDSKTPSAFARFQNYLSGLFSRGKS